MTSQECKEMSHDILADFLANTVDEMDDVVVLTKLVLAQFLVGIRKRYCVLGQLQKGIISQEDLIGVQIEELRICILDLTAMLNREEEVMQ